MHIAQHCRAVGAVQSSGFALIGLAALSHAAVRGFSPRFFDTCIIARWPSARPRTQAMKKAARLRGLPGSCRSSKRNGSLFRIANQRALA
jgi:hypothetical protein